MVNFRRPKLSPLTRTHIKVSVDRGDSSDTIFCRDFCADDNRISRKYLGRLVAEFKRGGTAEKPSTFREIGAPRKLKLHARLYLLSMMRRQQSQISIKDLSLKFLEEYYGRRKGPHIPGNKTLWRAIKKADYTLKVSEMRSKLQDPEEGLAFLEIIAFVNPKKIIDIDGINSNPDSFLEKRGWAIRGERSIRYHLQIAGKSYSCLGAFTYEGFVAWVVFDGTTSAIDVIEFIEDEVRNVVDRDSFCIIDNAAVNKTDDVVRSLHNVFRGMFKYSPRYQPRFKPIERAFSMIRKYIRKEESNGVLRNGMTPVQLINKAFTIYSKWGTKSHVAKNLWNRYFANHEFYINSF